ncbi:MAG: hypothetical protein P8Y71_08645 [Pseudolabrys sp.]
MEWYTILALLIGGLVAFMLIGLPVVFAFFAINLIGAWFVMGGDNGVLQLMRNSVQSVQSFALLPIPLFPRCTSAATSHRSRSDRSSPPAASPC